MAARSLRHGGAAAERSLKRVRLLLLPTSAAFLLRRFAVGSLCFPGFRGRALFRLGRGARGLGLTSGLRCLASLRCFTNLRRRHRTLLAHALWLRALLGRAGALLTLALRYACRFRLRPLRRSGGLLFRPHCLRGLPVRPVRPAPTV